MNRRLRLGLIATAIAVVLAAPIVLIVTRAGSGSAAFGDVEQVGRNRVSAATLAIEVGSRTVPIDVPDLAPGDLVSGQAELRNEGTLALRYDLEANASAPEIAPHLTWWFHVSESGACPTSAGWRAQPDDAIELTGLELAAGVAVLSRAADVVERSARVLDVGDGEVACFAVELHVDAPNDAQGKTVELDLVARAEQIEIAADAENDANDANDANGVQP